MYRVRSAIKKPAKLQTLSGHDDGSQGQTVSGRFSTFLGGLGGMAPCSNLLRGEAAKSGSIIHIKQFCSVDCNPL